MSTHSGENKSTRPCRSSGAHVLDRLVGARGVGLNPQKSAAGGHADDGGGGLLPCGGHAVDDQEDQVVQVEEDDLSALPYEIIRVAIVVAKVSTRYKKLVPRKN